MEKNEIELKNILEKNGYIVKYNQYLDIKFKIDLIAKKDQKTYFIQIKSKGFLYLKIKDLKLIQRKMELISKHKIPLIIFLDENVFKSINLNKIKHLNDDIPIIRLYNLLKNLDKSNLKLELI